MKALAILAFSFFIVPQQSRAADSDSSATYFYVARQHIEAMLSGNVPLSYERAIYEIENAWYGGAVDQQSFTRAIDKYIADITDIRDGYENTLQTSVQSDLLQTAQQKHDMHVRALANYSIYQYMTKVTASLQESTLSHHQPYVYAASDPMATLHWENSQVCHLLNEHSGNCFALASLYKIFADRLCADAKLCTAPGHIYIRHADEKGSWFNVELGNAVFPGSGTLATLTYTPNKAIKSNISLRELNDTQSVALCLVYLAKAYEYKYGTIDDEFPLSCTAAVLRYDEKNLNAMLLKAEILERQMTAQHRTVTQLQSQDDFQNYQRWISHIYGLGYREMPYDMKNILVKSWMHDTTMLLTKTNNIPQHRTTKQVAPTRYASLSWGVFDEEIRTKSVERYGNTFYDTQREKIIGFAESDVLYNQYIFDPVLFALSIDPLAHAYPGISPYTAFADNPIMFMDKDGEKVYGADGKPVTYEMLTNGKIVWSANASKATQRIGNAMLKTTTGKEMFAKMQEKNYFIELKFDKKSGEGSGTFGYTDVTWKKDENGNDAIDKVDLYVNENIMASWKKKRDAETKGIPNLQGVVKKRIASTPDGETKQGLQDYYLMINGKIDDVIGATASHEAGHATDEENLKASKENRSNPNAPKDIETEPNKIEQKDLDERTK
jgi:hypothetical protein